MVVDLVVAKAGPSADLRVAEKVECLVDESGVF